MEIVVDNGKALEPSNVKKAVAAVTRDTKAVITLPISHVQEIIARKLWTESPWLEKYKSASMEVTSDGAVITFSTKPVETTK